MKHRKVDSDGAIIPHSGFTITDGSESVTRADLPEQTGVVSKREKVVTLSDDAVKVDKDPNDLMYVKRIFTSEADDPDGDTVELDSVSGCGDIAIDSLNISSGTLEQLLDMETELDDVYAFGKRISRSASGRWSTRSCDAETRAVVALLNLARYSGYVFKLSTQTAMLYWTSPYGKPNVDNVGFLGLAANSRDVDFAVMPPSDDAMQEPADVNDIPEWIIDVLVGYAYRNISFHRKPHHEIISHVKRSDVQ